MACSGPVAQRGLAPLPQPAKSARRVSCYQHPRPLLMWTALRSGRPQATRQWWIPADKPEANCPRRPVAESVRERVRDMSPFAARAWPVPACADPTVARHPAHGVAWVVCPPTARTRTACEAASFCADTCRSVTRQASASIHPHAASLFPPATHTNQHYTLPGRASAAHRRRLRLHRHFDGQDGRPGLEAAALRRQAQVGGRLRGGSRLGPSLQPRRWMSVAWRSLG